MIRNGYGNEHAVSTANGVFARHRGITPFHCCVSKLEDKGMMVKILFE